jgi:hypothetical protein
MATILPTVYNQTKKWTAIVDSSIEDKLPGTDRIIERMIQQGIRQTTNMMTAPLPLDETAKKIIDLLEQQALRLSGKDSNIANYISHIHRVVKDAEWADSNSFANRIETLRLAGYRDDQVFPRNRAELVSLIEAKRSLASLQPIFKFCDLVKKAQETHAAPGKIQELIQKSKEFEGIENYQALRSARQTLENLSTPKPSGETLFPMFHPVENEPAPTSASYLRWSCSLIFNSLYYAGSIPWRISKFFFNR